MFYLLEQWYFIDYNLYNLYNINFYNFFINYLLLLPELNINLNIYFYNYSNSGTLFNQNLIFLDVLSQNILNNDLENIRSIYHYSIPNIKLNYTEPFIASPSFLYNDIWFIHILIYQYWLWFVFTYLIIFFFLIFLVTIRWCNIRMRPRRETRGVSRSKCGDLITACVPVSWAASIIVHESTDAIDFYDGFGTTEFAIGVRAYQWGWEYYYPKDIDLNYKLLANKSFYFGNSLKYDLNSSINTERNNLWRFYQNKLHDESILPAHILLLSSTSFNNLNLFNFDNIGLTVLNEDAAFKRFKYFSNFFNFNNNFLILSENRFSNFFFKNYRNIFELETSYNLKIKRVHNLFSYKASLNNSITYMDLRSFKKLFLLYSNFNNIDNENLFVNNSLNFYNLYLNSFNNNYSNKLNLLFFFFNDYYLLKNKFISNDYYLSPINYFNLEQKDPMNNLKYGFYKFFNNNYNSGYDFSLNYDKGYNLNLNYDLKVYKNWNKSMPDDGIALNDRTLVNNLNFKPQNYLGNNSLDQNSFNTIFNSNNFNNLNNSLYSYYLNNRSNWVNNLTLNKNLTGYFYLTNPASPIMSSNPNFSILNYDSIKNTKVENTSILFQGKDDMISPAYLTNYWNFYFINTFEGFRFFNYYNYMNINFNMSWPMHYFYYDNDYKRWQSNDLLEDTYWESTTPVILLDEYINFKKDYNKYYFLKKIDKEYYDFENRNKFKYNILINPYKTQKNNFNPVYPLSIYFDENILSYDLMNKNDFSYYYDWSNLNFSLDNSFNNWKYLYYIFNLNSNNFINLPMAYALPFNNIQLFNNFRADYDSHFFYLENNNFNNFFSNENYFKLLNLFKNDVNFKIFNDNNFSSIKINQQPQLINTVKNSMINYNAMQKVYKTRFDEGRSNLRLMDYSNSYVNIPFITGEKFNYRSLIGKNWTNYFNISFFKNIDLYPLNSYYNSINFFNYPFFDFPFLLAAKSDAAKYIWFDWWAMWSFCDIQPVTHSRYGLYGMPFFSHCFDFNPTSSEQINESEHYISRLNRVRRSSLPNWGYTPYFYSKSNNWFSENNLFNWFNLFKLNIVRDYFLLNFMQWFWLDYKPYNLETYNFFSGFSNITSYSKTSWSASKAFESYYYYLTTLVDILVKREYLYRELLENNSFLTIIPKNFESGVNNSIYLDLKSTFYFINPFLLNNEINLFNNNNLFFNNNLNLFIYHFSKIFNLKFIWNKLLLVYNNEFINDKLYIENDFTKKSQYKPMKKGITNMIRLHSTGAIALPVEVRLNLLTSSKDVIHSWAIPSAGIKIDCVPGYSSHKVTIFLASGIFWGQCMEICGRYHHWMPIVIYFMKKDLFFLWCIHFIFLKNDINLLQTSDKYYTDFNQIVQFDKESWIDEIKY